MSEGEEAKPRRRRGRRRGRRAAGPAQPPSSAALPREAAPHAAALHVSPPPDAPPPDAPPPAAQNPPARTPDSRRRTRGRLRTVHETSAGGLVVDGLDRPREEQLAALIGRMDRRGRMLWSLPKGHIEQGETAEQTAMREVAEETGIQGDVLAALGSIDYWFVTDGRRVHKTVHHYLLRFAGGELCDEDVEVTEVAWVPVTELPDRLAYADERRLARVAHNLIEMLQNDGADALPPLPPSAPRRRPQTHSNTSHTHTRNRPVRSDRRANGGGSDS